MRRAALLLISAVFPLFSHAQMWERLATSDYRIGEENVRSLRFEVDNLSFFRDNEYSSRLTKGYSLPGLWVEPKLVVTPLEQIELEVGAHALIFDGANKYPNYVYHDIGRWKGHQYQRGGHILPWVRAKAEFKHLTVVLGDIYGGENHRFTEPLFNSETNLSQDPEMGFQLLWDRRRLHADTWLNWQSYIFEEDSHQEAFTVGSNWQVRLGKMQKATQWWGTAQLAIQHRGGEQDTTSMGVQTLCNASLGGKMKWETRRKRLSHLGAEANLLATYQQSGHLWPFDSGLAFHMAGEAVLTNHLGLRAGLFHAPTHFVSLYGNHFFSTLSVRDGESHHGISTAYLRADYHYVFARHYALGAEAEAYQCWLGRSGQQGKSNEFNFSFGIYLRVNPSVWLKRW